MAIGKLRCFAIDVDDLDVAERFWSEVTGLPVISDGWPGRPSPRAWRRFSYLGSQDPWRHEVILHLVDRRKGEEPNRGHIDITVEDMAAAIEQVLAIGGSIQMGPTIFPRPGMFPGDQPVIEWSVMRDPFGNEFCLVRVLEEDEVVALEAAKDDGHDNSGDDAHWVAVARHARHHVDPRSDRTQSGVTTVASTQAANETDNPDERNSHG